MAEAFHGGLLPPDPIEQEKYRRLYSIANLDLAAPTEPVELFWDYADGLETFQDQGASGICVGASSCFVTTNRYSKIVAEHRFNMFRQYEECRRQMGSQFDPYDYSAGATMVSAGKAFVKRGAVEVINGKDQPWNTQWGAESYYWGLNAADMRLAAYNKKIVLHIGISWQVKFMTPRIIKNPVTGVSEFWIGTESSWGGTLGGHALCIDGVSDSHKWTPSSKGAFRLKNTWGADWPAPGAKGHVWLPYEAMDRLLSVGGEALLCIPRVITPPIILEQVDLLTVQPQTYGGMPSAHISVRNGGTEAIHLAGIGVHEKSNSAYDIGYWPLDLQPGEVWTVDKVGTKALGAGSYAYQLRYQTNSDWKDLGNVVSFSVAEPPPVPDPDVIHVPEMTATNSNGTVYVFKDLVGNKKLS